MLNGALRGNSTYRQAAAPGIASDREYDAVPWRGFDGSSESPSVITTSGPRQAMGNGQYG